MFFHRSPPDANLCQSSRATPKVPCRKFFLARLGSGKLIFADLPQIIANNLFAAYRIVPGISKHPPTRIEGKYTALPPSISKRTEIIQLLVATVPTTAASTKLPIKTKQIAADRPSADQPEGKLRGCRR